VPALPPVLRFFRGRPEVAVAMAPTRSLEEATTAGALREVMEAVR
jgi:hypothetical protein